MRSFLTARARNSGLVCLALLGAGCCLARAGEAKSDVKVVALPEADPWRFSLAVPGWLAATSGTIGLKGIDSDVYLGAKTLIKHLDMIATFSAEARKGRFGIYGDLLYVSASDGVGGDGLIKKLDVRLDEYLIDMELNYRVWEEPRGWLDVRAGVRYTNIYNKITLSPNDREIDQASTNLVDDVARLTRNRLSELGSRLRDAIGARVDKITDSLQELRDGRPVLPIAPVEGELPDRIRDRIREIVQRRTEALAAAIKAAAGAKEDQLRAQAQKRVAALKSKLTDEISRALESELDNTASLAEDWWDPYVGIRGRYNLSEKFYLTAKADIGGFGVGSRITWQASGALGYQATSALFIEAGYRYLYTDYDHGGFLYKTSQSGVEITAGITF